MKELHIVDRQSDRDVQPLAASARQEGAHDLVVDAVSVNYGGGPNVVEGVSIRVAPGSVVCLLGSNGAGKTTTLRAISGIARLTSGEVRAGDVDFKRLPEEQRVYNGLAHVSERRDLFPSLSVHDNILLGAYSRKRQSKTDWQEAEARVLDLFPDLKGHLTALAGTLSGGQAQMLAIARALMSRPRYLILDEPTLGLAPRIAHTVFERLRVLAGEGVAVLVAEQNARLALDQAEWAYVLERGRPFLDGPAEELRTDERVLAGYMGGR
jgi:branched-chain amino acid transport system ATP-binding protein